MNRARLWRVLLTTLSVPREGARVLSQRSSKMRRAAVALFAVLLAGAAPEACVAAPYQVGVTTEDDASMQLGQPDSVTLQADGSFVYVYKMKPSPGVLDYVPLLGLLTETSFPDVAILTFTFDPKTKLTGYTAT
jgi:hypothetical protein